MDHNEVSVETHRSERALALLLKAVGIVALCAIPAIVMPHAWMDAIHRRLGLGELPRMPIVGYLTRSVSALYAMLGALLVMVSLDVRRYGSLIRLIAALFVIGGAVVLLIDIVVGMPWFWTLGEGPFVLAFGVVLFALARRVP